MAPTLYMVKPSPAVRAVLITAKAIGVDLKLKELDFMKGEHLAPEYLKLNPQHTVPTLEDGEFIVWDSHAISTYLVSKYAKNDALYSKDIKKRALIDQRLHFDTGVAFPSGASIVFAVLRKNKTSINEQDIESLNNVYSFVESFLDGKTWIAGESISLADYHIFATLTSGNVLVPIDEQKYPKLTAWFKKVENLPEAAANKEGLAAFTHMIKSRLQS